MNKILYLRGNVDDSKVKDLITDVNWLNNEESPKYKTIELHIDSSGGDVYAGFSLMTAIINSKIPIYTYAYGKVQSIALLIYCAGEKRFATKFSNFMYHFVQTSISHDYISNVKIFLEEVERLQSIGDEFLVNRTNLTYDLLKNYSSSCCHFSWEDAIRHNICTNIIK